MGFFNLIYGMLMTNNYDWETLRNNIKKWGIENSLLTAQCQRTSQILEIMSVLNQ